MKKIFIAIFLLCSLAYAENITGILGVKFGSKQSKVKSILNKKEWTLKSSDNTEYVFVKNNGTFADMEVEELHIFFNKKGKFSAVTFLMKPVKNTVHLLQTITLIKDKYEFNHYSSTSKKQKDYIFAVDFYIDKNKNLFSASNMIYDDYTIPVFRFINTEFNKDDIDTRSKEDKILSDL